MGELIGFGHSYIFISNLSLQRNVANTVVSRYYDTSGLRKKYHTVVSHYKLRYYWAKKKVS